MQKGTLKQLLFFIVLVVTLVIVMGIVLSTAANAGDFGIRGQDWDWDEDWDDDWDDSSKRNFDIRYNRVEGLYLGYQINKEYWIDRYPRRPVLYGSAGFGFSTKEFQYQLGLEKGFFDKYRLAFGGEYHMLTDTPDRWIMPELENSLAAFLIREDFHDFYHRDGVSGYVTQNIGEEMKLSLAYHFDDYDTEKRNTSWSLFGGKKKFRKNPDMHTGEIHSMVGRLEFDTRNSVKRTTRGWFIQAEGEHAGSDLGGDFNFDRMLVDIRRYQPLGFGEGFDVRLRVGTSHGDLPWQKSYHLGGVSTLRGFSYKQFPDGPMTIGGNRMVLVQIEYRLGMQDLPEELGLGLFDYFHLILFVDAGWVGTADTETGLFNGFQSLSWTTLKNDVGFALSNRSGSVRIQIARRTDTGESPFVFLFRINRPF